MIRHYPHLRVISGFWGAMTAMLWWSLLLGAPPANARPVMLPVNALPGALQAAPQSEAQPDRSGPRPDQLTGAVGFTLSIESLEHSRFRAEGLHLSVHFTASGFSLDATIDRVYWPGVAKPLRKIRIHCPRLIGQTDGEWRCAAARWSVEDSPLGPLNAPMAIAYNPVRQQLRVNGSLALVHPEVGVAWLGRDFTLAGKMDYNLTFDYAAPGRSWLTGQVTLADLNIGDSLGEIGCENLTVVLHPEITLAPESISIAGHLEIARGGVVYKVTATNPFAFDTLTAAMRLRLALRYQFALDRLDILDMTLDHPPLVSASLTARVQPLQSLGLSSLQSATLNLSRLDIAPFLATYALPGVEPGNWQLSGQLQGYAEHQPRGDSRMTLQLSDVSVSEKYFERLTLDGLSGVINLSRQRPEASRLAWRRLAFKRLETYQTRVALYTQGSTLTIPSLRLPFSEGALELNQIVCTNCLDPQRKVSASARMNATPIAVFAPLVENSAPSIPGVVSLVMPSIIYQNDRVDLAGKMVADVFDGQIVVDDLMLDGLTGRAPRMEGSVAIERLDLETLTQTVNFGRITGRMSGYVRDMEWVNWVPVAFDAKVFSTPGDPTRKRISQKAVDALTEIGGAGGALAQSYLRFFQEFSYANLGLSCRLAGDVCHLGGVDQSPLGFYILKGAGLPYISIMGDRAETSWSDLLDKIRVIIDSQSGAAPDPARE